MAQHDTAWHSMASESLHMTTMRPKEATNTRGRGVGLGADKEATEILAHANASGVVSILGVHGSLGSLVSSV